MMVIAQKHVGGMWRTHIKRIKCRSCFSVNFNVIFKIVFKTIHLCISWWIKNFGNMRLFLISVFCHVLNVVFFLLGDSPASEFYIPKFQNTVCSVFIGSVSRKNNLIPVIFPTYTAYEDGKECYETSAFKMQMQRNHPKERIRQIWGLFQCQVVKPHAQTQGGGPGDFLVVWSLPLDHPGESCHPRNTSNSGPLVHTTSHSP
jgi:hypothetical protein